MEVEWKSSSRRNSYRVGYKGKVSVEVGYVMLWPLKFGLHDVCTGRSGVWDSRTRTTVLSGSPPCTRWVGGRAEGSRDEVTNEEICTA